MARTRVFESEEEVSLAIMRGQIRKGDVVVIRYEVRRVVRACVIC